MMLGKASNRLIYLSIAAAVTTFGLKFGAYLLTGSVGLLSDAAESIVNVVAAFAALAALIISARPPDSTHTYGHQKIEYFSSGIEGTLIFVAAFGIAYAGMERLFNPQGLQDLGLGLIVSLVATIINLAVGRLLVMAGRRDDNIVLEADGQHLMTDVVTSIGVAIGIGLVWLTGWLWLDAVVALLVAVNIVFTARSLMARSFDGLMDKALPEAEVARICAAIESVRQQELNEQGVHLLYHGLRTRKSGSRRFADLHLLTPGGWTVAEAHQRAEAIEQAVQQVFPEMQMVVHIEPIEDPRAYNDTWESVAAHH